MKIKRHKTISLFTVIVMILVSVVPVQQAAAQNTPEDTTGIKRIIFLDFYNQSELKDYRWIEQTIGQTIDHDISQKYRYIKVPESEWRTYAEENNFKPADFFNSDKVYAMGEALEAHGIIYGKFRLDNETGKLIIDGRILSIQAEDILAQEQVSSPISSRMFTVVENISQTLADRIKDLFVPSDWQAAWRAALLPGWGHLYKFRPYWGYTWMGTVGASAAFSGVSLFLYLQAVDEYNSYEPETVSTPSGETALVDPVTAESEFNRLEGNVDSAKSLVQTSLIVLGSLYALNIIHAWFIGPETGLDVIDPGSMNKKGTTVSMGILPRNPSAGRYSSEIRFTLLQRF